MFIDWIGKKVLYIVIYCLVFVRIKIRRDSFFRFILWGLKSGMLLDFNSVWCFYFLGFFWERFGSLYREKAIFELSYFFGNEYWSIFIMIMCFYCYGRVNRVVMILYVL